MIHPGGRKTYAFEDVSSQLQTYSRIIEKPKHDVRSEQLSVQQSQIVEPTDTVRLNKFITERAARLDKYMSLKPQEDDVISLDTLDQAYFENNAVMWDGQVNGFTSKENLDQFYGRSSENPHPISRRNLSKSDWQEISYTEFQQRGTGEIFDKLKPSQEEIGIECTVLNAGRFRERNKELAPEYFKTLHKLVAELHILSVFKNVFEDPSQVTFSEKDSDGSYHLVVAGQQFEVKRGHIEPIKSDDLNKLEICIRDLLGSREAKALLGDESITALLGTIPK
ncbi:MAG: hypothetical protein ACI9BD_001471 [Candidatus Marinamargulisbacteria bacterium]|jgi:hypothetical protein